MSINIQVRTEITIILLHLPEITTPLISCDHKHVNPLDPGERIRHVMLTKIFYRLSIIV